MKPAHHIRTRIVRWDWTLAGLAVLGLLCYVWQYPTQHFNGVIRHDLDEADAVAASRGVLEANGANLAGLHPVALLQWDEDLIDDLQIAQGRQHVVSMLKGEAIEQVPGLYWLVRWYQSEGRSVDRQYTTRLTVSGRLFDLSRSTAGLTTQRLHEPALGYALQQGSGPAPLPPDLTASLNLDRGFRLFMDSIRTQFKAPEWQPPAEDEAPGNAADAALLVGLARYHLNASSLDVDGFRVDSLWVPTTRGLGTAGVRFASSAPRHGMDTEVEMEFALSGQLMEMNTTFERTATVPAPTFWSAYRQAFIISMALYVLLIFVFCIAFFRRHGAGAIDTKGALWDTLLLGLGAGMVSVFAFGYPNFARMSMQEGWEVYFNLIMSSLFGGAGISVLIFIVAGVSDSIARGGRRDRMTAWRMLRARFARSKPVGRSLLRGVALGVTLVGVLTLYLALVPGSRITIWENQMLDDWLLFPGLTAPLYYAWTGFVTLAIILVCLGTWLERRNLPSGLIVLLLGLVFGFTQLWPEYLSPVPQSFVLSTLLGAGLVAAYLFYNFLTVFIGLLVMRILWVFGTGWAVEGSPLFLDMLFGFGIVVALAGVGFVFSRYGRDQREIPEYVPDYIKTLARQKRMERELEIAHDVQMSFLPQQMPKVDGVDLAGMCLAAHEVGGDYYDVVELGQGRLALVIGDVSGKGIQAAFYMTLVKGFIRTLCREVDSPAEVLRRTNRLFFENAPRGTFISMIYGVLDVQQGKLTFARAGHNPVILKRSPNQIPETVMPRGLGIGLVNGDAFDSRIEEEVLTLRLGDVVVFYTDGFSEAMNPVKALYGDQPLVDKVAEVGKYQAREILNMISSDVHLFMAGAEQHDDMTMIVVKFTAPAPAAHPDHADAYARSRS